MIQNNEGLNTARMVANNGQVFIEGTSATTGTWFGFTPHKDGCIIAAITITNADGDTIDETHASVSSWIGTTASLDSFMGAGVVQSSKGSKQMIKGYITSITLTSGAATMHNDTMAKI